MFSIKFLLNSILLATLIISTSNAEESSRSIEETTKTTQGNFLSWSSSPPPPSTHGSITEVWPSNYKNACDTRKNCTMRGTVCLNGQCLCAPDRFYRQGECRRMSNCLNLPFDNVCEDPNRECRATLSWFKIGTCVCKNGFIEDPITKACRPTCSFKTIKEHPCPNIDGPNSICNIYRCQCQPNYRRNATGHCEPFTCTTNSSCWSDGDVYRTCRNGTCTCDFDVDPLTSKCTLKFGSIFTWRYYSNWHAEKLLLCTIIITPLVFYYCLVANLRKAKSTIVAYKAAKPGDANFQPSITIHAIMTSDAKRTYGSEVANVLSSKYSPQNETKKKMNSDKFKYERFK